MIDRISAVRVHNVQAEWMVPKCLTTSSTHLDYTFTSTFYFFGHSYLFCKVESIFGMCLHHSSEIVVEIDNNLAK